MALTGKPAATGIQVGSDAYFMYNNIPQTAKVVRTSSEVTNPNSDNNGITKVVYYLEGLTKSFEASDLFSSPEALITSLASILALDIDFPPSIH